ncbi:hypothetical protein Tco_1227334 [Tanacetum coccineum]
MSAYYECLLFGNLQIAKDNGLLWNQASNGSGVVKVMNSMVEDLIESGQIEPHSVDVLVSGMGWVLLLYETMHSSVLVCNEIIVKAWRCRSFLILLPPVCFAGIRKSATSVPFLGKCYGSTCLLLKELVDVCCLIFPIVLCGGIG